MGTTLVGVLLCGNLAYYLNAGDGKLYRLRDGYLAQIARDHPLIELTGNERVVYASLVIPLVTAIECSSILRLLAGRYLMEILCCCVAMVDLICLPTMR